MTSEREWLTRKRRIEPRLDARGWRLPAQVLAAAGIAKGRELTGYPACGPEVRAAGGTYVDVPVDRAHVDGLVPRAFSLQSPS